MREIRENAAITEALRDIAPSPDPLYVLLLGDTEPEIVKGTLDISRGHTMWTTHYVLREANGNVLVFELVEIAHLHLLGGKTIVTVVRV